MRCPISIRSKERPQWDEHWIQHKSNRTLEQSVFNQEINACANFNQNSDQWPWLCCIAHIPQLQDISSFQVVTSSLLVNDIKHWFGTEVSRVGGSHSLVGKGGILVIYDDRLLAPRPRSGLCQQLSVAALIHAHKPKDGLVDSLPDGQKSMVLQQRSLLGPNTTRDVASLLGSKHNPVEGLVDGVVIVEGAGVLGDCIQLAAQGAEGSSVYCVGMTCCIHFRPGLVDSGVL